MTLPELSVKRPVLAAVMSLIIVVIGFGAFFSLPLRELPDIDQPVVSVSTAYRGASAEVVETRVTEVIENQLSGLEGIDRIESSSRDGRSNITITFQLDRNLDDAANDVRDAVARVAGALPVEADPPQVEKADSSAVPIMFINVSSTQFSPLELNDYVDRYVIDRLSTIDGVARAQVFGAPRYSMRIWLDREAMAARGVTVDDVEAALRRQNVEMPAGSLESASVDFTVRADRTYRSPEDFARLPLFAPGAQGAGYAVRLGDVARVEEGPDERRRFFRGNGVPQLGMGIVRQSRANDILIADQVYQRLDEIRVTLPEHMSILIAFDGTVFTRGAIEEVWVTLIVAIGLVALVNYIFLGTWRAALMPSIVAPICVLGAFIALAPFGFSINLLTLLAIVLAIGLVVDDAIVVTENMQRRVELGEPRMVAAMRGGNQVYFAVIATTLVLFAVFAPLFFLPGYVGRLFIELAAAIAGAVAISSLLALTLTPMMGSKLLRESKSAGPVARAVDWAMSRFRASYEASLGLVVQRPLASFLIAGAIGAAAIGLLQVVRSELVPIEDRGRIDISINGPEGAGFDAMTEHFLDVEQRLMKYTETGDVFRVIMVAPSFGDTRFSTARGIVVLSPWEERARSLETILNDMQRDLGGVTGARAVASARAAFSQGGGGGGGGDVSVVLLGADFEQMAQAAGPIVAAARANPGLTRVRTSYEPNAPRLVLDIDRERAAALGVSVEQIGRTLETMFGSRRVTTYLREGQEYDVLLQAGLENRRSLEDLVNVHVRTASGELAPLTNLINTKVVGDNADRRRTDRLRAITINANIGPGYTLGEAIAFMETTLRAEAPEVSYTWSGAARDFQQAGNAIAIAFALALLVVFLVLAAQFESFIHPAIIMTTVPLAIFGGLFGLFMAGSTLNIYSQIGLIILVGIATKNGILIVEFANQLRDEGRGVREAIIEAAGLRLRPIIMTSLTTVMGALPLMLTTGPGAESRFTIGVTIFAGVAFATLVTLFIVPAFYNALARFTKSPEWNAQQIKSFEDRENMGQAAE